jgi:hypothetical protein
MGIIEGLLEAIYDASLVIDVFGSQSLHPDPSSASCMSPSVKVKRKYPSIAI